jgi:hypothetical protein
VARSTAFTVAGAALHAGDALEKLDARLVFQRHILLAGDGHAVDLESRGQVDRKAANFVVAVVAHRRVVLADGGVVLHHVREQARALVQEQLVRHHRGRKRRLLKRRTVQSPHHDCIGKIIVLYLAAYHDRGGDGLHLLLRFRRVGRLRCAGRQRAL